MKIVISLFAALLCFSAAAQDNAEALFQKGQELIKAKNYTAAIEEFRKASEAPDLAPERKARIMLSLAEACLRCYNRALGLKTVAQIEAMQGIPESVVNEALILKVKLTEDVALGTRDWTDVRKVCEGILRRESLTAEQRVCVRQRLADTLFLHLKDYPAARKVYSELLASDTALKGTDPQDVPFTVLAEAAPGSADQQTLRFNVMYNIGRCYLFEKDYPAARKIFLNILNMQGMSEQFRGFARLYVGLTFFHEHNFAAAKEEFEKIPTTEDYWRLPWDGGRSSYNPPREAKLRLAFIDNPPNLKKVLFVGSSATFRGDIPGTVIKMSESAPPDRIRIVASEYIDMGTPLARHWEEGGEGSASLLWEIDSLPWNAVVYEIYYSRAERWAKNIDYAPRMVERLRARNILSVIYETNPFLTDPKQSFDLADYFNEFLVKVPDGSTAYAPGARAFIEYLGPHPTKEKLDEVYADKYHGTGKGAYLLACCIYAALTGQSPVGLYHPEYVTPVDAKSFQELAWNNYRAMNPFKAPVPPKQ